MPSHTSINSLARAIKLFPSLLTEKEDTGSTVSTLLPKKSSWYLEPDQDKTYTLENETEVTLWPASVTPETDETGFVSNVKISYLVQGRFNPEAIQYAAQTAASHFVSYPATYQTTLRLTSALDTILKADLDDNVLYPRSNDYYLDIDINCNAYASTQWYQYPFEQPKTKKQLAQESIKNKLRVSAPINHHGRIVRASQVDFSHAPPEEIKALQLLRKIIGQAEFREYLRTGNLSYRAKSGLTYVIRRRMSHVLVYNSGKLVCELCIHSAITVPPTDTVIMKLLYAQHSEHTLWQKSNVHWKIDRMAFGEEHPALLAVA